MNDKPKYRMLINPFTGKRFRMTEEQISTYANPPAWMIGGTCSPNIVYKILAAQEWVKLHAEAMQ